MKYISNEGQGHIYTQGHVIHDRKTTLHLRWKSYGTITESWLPDITMIILVSIIHVIMHFVWGRVSKVWTIIMAVFGSKALQGEKQILNSLWKSLADLVNKK